MLSQLTLAGKLTDPAAVILGGFTNCGPNDEKKEFTIDEVIEQYFANRPYPVLKNFPVGHTDQNATLPLGTMVEVNCEKECVTLLEDPVELD